jgi:hypothetical protein
MRTIIALATALAALVAASPAAAKELALTVCGAQECASVTDVPELRALVSLTARTAPPAAEAPFYAATLRAMGSAGVVRTFLYVPSAGALRIEDATPFWTSAPAPLRRALAQATEGLEPFPAAPASDGRVPVWPALVAAAAALALVAAALRRVRRRRLAAVGLAALAVLALPGLASAKGWGNPRLCGPAGCTRAGVWLNSLPAGEAQTVPAPAPFYELRTCRTCWRVWYVPSAHALAPRAGSTFTLVTAEAAASFERLAVGLEPFPAPFVTAAFVGGRRVTGDASSYARLFELESAGPAVNAGTDWVPIDLRSEQDTPWTNGATYLAYSPRKNLLQRGPELIRVPDPIARRLDRAVGLVVRRPTPA